MGLIERVLPTTAESDGEKVDRSDAVGAGPLPDPPARPSDAPFELGMTAEAYVHRLVAEQNGRAYQESLVEATGWSKATVSRLLSGMEDADAVVRRRIGRRKVVYLPEFVEESPTLR